MPASVATSSPAHADTHLGRSWSLQRAPALPAAVSSHHSPRRRPAFVLAGGASLGAMQVGMLRALYERGITPDLLVGTSAGALNAAFIASRAQTVATAEELAHI